MGGIGIIDGRLKKILIDSSDVMVSLDLTGHIVAVQSESANVLADLLYWFQGLNQLGAFFHHFLPQTHSLARRD